MHDALTLLEQLQHQAWHFDFFSALRCIDALDPKAPRLGTAEHLHQDPIRLAQAVSLAFEPSMLHNLQLREGLAPRLAVTFFGLTGVNGPMPLAFSEDVLSRQVNHNDYVLAHFLDIFHHRLLSLLYRSWAMTRPVVSADRPSQDRFAEYVQAFAPRSERYYVSNYIDQRRSAESLLELLRDHVRVPVSLQQWYGRRSDHAVEEWRLGLGADRDRLGKGSFLGRRVWNVQHSVRLRFGPLSLAELMRFLPGTPAWRSVVRLVNDYLGDTFEWDLQLLLASSENTQLSLGSDLPLGHASWISSASHSIQHRACVLNPARIHRNKKVPSHD